MNCIVDIIGDFKPGDPRPEGYSNWHAWAEVQHKAGLKQSRCCKCGKWYFPKEHCGHSKSDRMTQKELDALDAHSERIAKMMETNTGRKKLGFPPLMERDDWIPRFPGDKPPKDRGFKIT